jgi:hypothetical protein
MAVPRGLFFVEIIIKPQTFQVSVGKFQLSSFCFQFAFFGKLFSIIPF